MVSRWAITAVTAVVLHGQSYAVVQRSTPLKSVLASETWIWVGRIDRLDAERFVMSVAHVSDLKECWPHRQMTVDLRGDAAAQKNRQTPQLLERLRPGMELVLFGSDRMGRTTLFAFSNGTWFQITAEAKSSDSAFTHFEPYLRRTFKGSTAELKAIVADALAGKKEPPPIDTQEPPGLGPPVRS